MHLALPFLFGISLYLQGTLNRFAAEQDKGRYIPVPTGNSTAIKYIEGLYTVYPCTYRELKTPFFTSACEAGISLYLQGTLALKTLALNRSRYIPVPTGNSKYHCASFLSSPVYPCTYRELILLASLISSFRGISLYLQGTRKKSLPKKWKTWYIPVPTGNSCKILRQRVFDAVYPCTYRELTAIFTICYCHIGISLYLQGTRYTSVCRSEQTRYIPVPTGNSFNCSTSNFMAPVYPCTYRELDRWKCHCAEVFGISLYLQGTHKYITE